MESTARIFSHGAVPGRRVEGFSGTAGDAGERSDGVLWASLWAGDEPPEAVEASKSGLLNSLCRSRCGPGCRCMDGLR